MQFAIVACALLGVALGQYTGFPGYQGYQGYQGYPGYQGYNQGYNNRYQGYNGIQGYPGYQGYNQGYNNRYQGYNGIQGYPGYNGYNGYQGYPGYQGYRPQISPVKPLEVKKETAEKIQEAIIKPTTVAPAVPVVRPVVQGAYNPVAAGPYFGIRSQQQDSSPDGSYQYSFETENGIAVAEKGVPSVGPAGEEEIVTGQYAYTAPNGEVITVRYTADKDGFHPEGAHLPGSARSAAYTAETYRPYGYQRSSIFAPVEAPVVPVIAKPAAVPEKKEE